MPPSPSGCSLLVSWASGKVQTGRGLLRVLGKLCFIPQTFQVQPVQSVEETEAQGREGPLEFLGLGLAQTAHCLCLCREAPGPVSGIKCLPFVQEPGKLSSVPWEPLEGGQALWP